ncbi:MAG TPA: hypothetical protein DCG46_03065 [Gammaproteobacteria bacterium]|jgi:hypothetical protein|nr:hypothetical protein [Gammaproteobacteria bacterium]HAG47872.1 hypothetical protein [Gammaproteobacteria bacterium]HAN33861.1 hypothetical protein [Gammaproteobacteria bacterium]HAO38163.1 hypothetical protein [Gammaproteobacteria bacterium]HAO44417.1 hypothetical protein [Gammaproteobacteria bacterium]
MKESRLVLIILLITFVIYSVFYLSTRDVEIPDNQAMPWQSYVNDQGKTVVFDLTMDESTLAESMRLFGTEVEASLFEDKDQKKTLEIFFSNTKVGGISAKVIINLALNDQQFNYLSDNIKETEVMPSGNKKTIFNQAGESSMFGLTISALTFIPSADLSADTLLGLFKKPARVELVEPGVEYWYYPSKGLRIIVDAKRKEILEFYNL